MTAVRQGRGKAQKTLALIDASIRILREIKPATIRAVCYRLFVEGFIPSMAKVNTDAVSRHLVWAREQGQLPWAWVVDETREAERINSWSNPDAIITDAVKQYRKDYSQMQPQRIEVWSEKGTIRGTLASVLDEYGITFRVMHGYGSATALYGIAQETAGNPKPLTVLYVGDWDPSGMQMSEVDLPDRLRRYEGAATIKRVALDAADVAPDTDLPSFEAETKSKDPRFRWFVEHYGRQCWEVDALSPVVLRQRVEAEILALLDIDAWNHCIDVERAERESMQDFLGSWSISMQARKYSDDDERGAR